MKTGTALLLVSMIVAIGLPVASTSAERKPVNFSQENQIFTQIPMWQPELPKMPQGQDRFQLQARAPLNDSSDAHDPIQAARNSLVRDFPLHWAAIQNQADVIVTLVELGIDVNARNFAGRTPVMTAAEFGNVEALAVLTDLGGDIQLRDNEDGATALHLAARHGRVNAMEYLAANGVHVDIPTSQSGASPLHYAAEFQQLKAIEFLFKAGANIEAKDRRGVSPLFYASRKIRRAAERKLLELGARAGGLHEAVNAGDVARVHRLIRAGSDTNEVGLSGTPLAIAVVNGDAGIAGILLDNGAEPEKPANSFGALPLHLAVMVKQPEMVRLLIERGARVDGRDGEDRTPLMMAATFGHLPSAQHLMEHGADPALQDTFYGMSAIHWASQNGNSAIVELLLSKGVDKNSKTVRSRQSALHLAVLKNHPEVASLLVRHGADTSSRDSHGNTPLQLKAYHGNSAASVLRELEQTR